MSNNSSIDNPNDFIRPLSRLPASLLRQIQLLQSTTESHSVDENNEQYPNAELSTGQAAHSISPLTTKAMTTSDPSHGNDPVEDDSDRPDDAILSKNEPTFDWSGGRPLSSCTPTETITVAGLSIPLDEETGEPSDVPDADELSEYSEEEDDDTPKAVTGVPCAVWSMLALGAIAGGLGAMAPGSAAGPSATASLLKAGPAPQSNSPTDLFFPKLGNMLPCSQDTSCSLVMDALDGVIPSGTEGLFDIPGTCQSKSRDWLRVGKDILEFTPERIRQRYVFSMFFCETDGGNWLENDMWMSDLHECDWYNRVGLDPCNRFEQMEMVRIHDNGLQGTLPVELSIVTTLYEITLSDNLMTGTFPSEYAALSDLDTFCIAFNLFEGPIPGFIFRFPDMVYLDIAYNRFTGTLPTDIPSRMPDLQILFMENNEISGPIPDNLGELNLRRVHMDDNKLTGTVPTSLGNCPRLQQLYLHNNDLSGTIPSTLINNEVLNSATFQGNTKMTGENVDELNEACEKLVYAGAGQLTGFTVECASITCNCCECPVV